jgi:hypothetical protein
VVERFGVLLERIGLVDLDGELAAGDEAGDFSANKELRTFTTAAGGAGHVNTDDPDSARQYIADWFARRLGTEQPAT